jgi:hypothetical protein
LDGGHQWLPCAAAPSDHHARVQQYRRHGERINGPGINALGWVTTAAMFAAAMALFFTWGNA